MDLEEDFRRAGCISISLERLVCRSQRRIIAGSQWSVVCGLLIESVLGVGSSGDGLEAKVETSSRKEGEHAESSPGG